MNASSLSFPIIPFAIFLLVGGIVPASAASGDTQTVAGGGVTVAVTYTNPRIAEAPRFQVALNTHSVALDAVDLKTLTLLREDTGKTYVPEKVENKGSGHHRQMTLTFPKLSADAKLVEVVIRDVAGVKERTFRWKLK